MSNALIEDVESRIRNHNASIVRYGQIVPMCLSWLVKMREQKITALEFVHHREVVANLMETTVRFIKMDRGISGNFPFKFWKTEEGLLIGYGYKLLFADKWIDHTTACAILFDRDNADYRRSKQASLDQEFLHRKYLYPRNKPPLLTAYHDCDVTVIGQGARVIRGEVEALKAKEGK